MENPPEKSLPSFAIISVLGAPGAGKGTLSTHLAETYSLRHYSVGDSLRRWMCENRATPLAAQIQNKLDNQGFLSPRELKPFLYHAIEDAIHQNNPKHRGILLDGFPRCIEQLESFSAWPLQDSLSLVPNQAVEAISYAKPDIVLSFQVTKQNAKARYSSRARDSNDNEEKFERRFVEYKAKTMPVVDVYRQRGIVIDVDVNGTKEENIESLARNLDNNEMWQKVVVEGGAGMLVQG